MRKSAIALAIAAYVFSFSANTQGIEKEGTIVPSSALPAESERVPIKEQDQSSKNNTFDIVAENEEGVEDNNTPHDAPVLDEANKSKEEIELSPSSPASHEPTEDHTLPEGTQEELAGLMVNDKPYSQLLTVLTNAAKDDVFFTKEEWQDMGIVISGSGLLSAKENGVEVEFDQHGYFFKLTSSASLLKSQQFSRTREWVTETNRQPKGVLINYDYAANKEGSGPVSSSMGYDARIGLGKGTLVSTGQLNQNSEREVEHRRGLTTYYWDFLEKGITFHIGDVFPVPSQLTSSVNLGGIHIGTERELRRGEIYYPVPVIGGIAQTGSSAELFVNAVRSSQYQLEPGPFSIENIPLLTGRNEIQVVVRDEFGRETVLVKDFHLNQDLLAKGRHEWGVTAGKIRTSQENNEYNDIALSSFYTRGLSDYWTVGVNVEYMKNHYNTALSNSFSLGRFGQLQFDVAKSQANDTSGHALSGSYSVRANNFTINASHSQYSENHWKLGDNNLPPTLIEPPLEEDDLFRPPQRFRVKSSSNISLSYVWPDQKINTTISGSKIEDYAGKTTTRADLGLSWGIDSKNSVSARASYDLNTQEKNIALMWRYRFHDNLNASLTARPAPSSSASLQVNGKYDFKQQRIDWGLGHTQSEEGQSTFAHAQTNTSKGNLNINVRQGASSRSYNGRFEGSVWVGEGGVMFQPSSRNAFAVIEVPNVSGVSLLNATGSGIKTNKRGFAVVPNIYPLSPHSIRLDTVNLPLTTQIENATLQVVAPRFGGAKVEFKVPSQTMREFFITYENKEITPPATVITANEKTAIGFGGIFYLNEATPSEDITVRMEDGKTCVATLPNDLGDYLNIIMLECK